MIKMYSTFGGKVGITVIGEVVGAGHSGREILTCEEARLWLQELRLVIDESERQRLLLGTPKTGKPRS